jgi:biotin carboxyl carrier protein
VVSVHKAVGDSVARGETIVTIESMKLQTALIAPRDGVIAELYRKEGESFEKDEMIVRLEGMTEGTRDDA